MKQLIGVLIVLIAGAMPAGAIAQESNPTPKHLMREDSAAVHALAMYPDTIRLHIFQACEYPAAIVSIASLQKTTSDDFANYISTFSRNEQEDFWNLTRYPGLIARLVQGGKKSAREIEEFLPEYPADIHETAVKYGTGYYDQLVNMDAMQAHTDSVFDQIVGDYPPETEIALRDIVQYPEIISLLNEHLSLTVRVGDRFRRNPERVIHRADSLHLALTTQLAEDADAWKQNLELNPDEEEDLQQAANDYATENGYTPEEVGSEPSQEEISNYSVTPYSYWFGYPRWYPYDYWYPYPFWFDCGFYHNRSGKLVIFGAPSNYFTSWYFYHPEHWHHYPRLCNAYIDHYYGPHRSVGGNTIVVHNWVRENKNYLSRDFITDRTKRTEQIRQVGQLYIDVQKQKGKTISPAVRDQYFQTNKTKYPSLVFEQNKRLVRDDKQFTTPSILAPPVKQPPVRIVLPVQQPVRNTPQSQPPERSPRQTPEQLKTPPQPPQREQNTPPVREPARVSPQLQEPAKISPNIEEPVRVQRQQVTPPSYNFNNINKAQEYHKDVWEQTQPTVRQQVQQAPRPQVQQPVRQEPVNRPPPQQPANRPPPGKRQ